MVSRSTGGRTSSGRLSARQQELIRGVQVARRTCQGLSSRSRLCGDIFAPVQVLKLRGGLCGLVGNVLGDRA